MFRYIHWYNIYSILTVTDFIFLGSHSTANNDCSCKIKRHLLLGRKAMINLDSIKKQRHHFVDKGLSTQSYGFSSSHVHMWEKDHKEGWAPKKWCFRPWSWRIRLRIPWTIRRSNQSILKEINPEYSLEGLMLKPKLQYTLASWCEESTHWKKPWFWERLRVGGEGGDRG